MLGGGTCVRVEPSQPAEIFSETIDSSGSDSNWKPPCSIGIVPTSARSINVPATSGCEAGRTVKEPGLLISLYGFDADLGQRDRAAVRIGDSTGQGS